MSDSLPASDAALLGALVQVCWGLAAASVVVWLGCFFLRLRRLKQAARAACAEEKLTGIVFDEIAGNPVPDDTYARLPDWQRRILLRVLQNLVGQIRGADQTRLIALMQRAGFLETALRTLASRRAGERYYACVVLGYYDQPSAIAALQGALKDRDLAVRLAAVRALVQRDRIESIRTLLADLDFSPDDPPLILTEIFAHISARLRPEAIRLLTEPIPDEWKRMLAIALGRNHVPEAFDGILALSRLPSPRLRAAAWVALRELADPRAGETVGEGLRDGSASVRRAACAAAAVFGDPGVLPQLLALLADADWRVRFSAASALHDFGPEGRALLVQHANTAPEDDVGLQVLRERQMEDQYGI